MDFGREGHAARPWSEPAGAALIIICVRAGAVPRRRASSAQIKSTSSRAISAMSAACSFGRSKRQTPEGVISWPKTMIWSDRMSRMKAREARLNRRTSS